MFSEGFSTFSTPISSYSGCILYIYLSYCVILVTYSIFQTLYFFWFFCVNIGSHFYIPKPTLISLRILCLFIYLFNKFWVTSHQLFSVLFLFVNMFMVNFACDHLPTDVWAVFPLMVCVVGGWGWEEAAQRRPEARGSFNLYFTWLIQRGCWQQRKSSTK